MFSAINQIDICFSQVLLSLTNPLTIPPDADTLVSTTFKCIFHPKECLRCERAQPFLLQVMPGSGSLGFAKKTCLMKLKVYFVMPFYVFFFLNFVESDMLNQV